MRDRDLALYVICPGTVTSRTDGQEHFVDERSLISLYGVHPALCVVYPRTEAQERGWRMPPHAMYLEPQYSGDYSLPIYYGPKLQWKLKSHTPVLAAKLLSASTFLSLFQ